MTQIRITIDTTTWTITNYEHVGPPNHTDTTNTEWVDPEPDDHKWELDAHHHTP